MTSFTPDTWADGPAGGTPITAAKLTNMEQGISNLFGKIGAANGTATLDANKLLPVAQLPALPLIGGAWAFFGDSITNFGEGYPYYVAGLSKGQIYAQLVDSYPGYTSTALLPKITDVTQATKKAAACLILCGSNDANASATVATYSANIISMVAQLMAAGIQPVLGTIPPRNGAPTTYVNRYNVWLRRYCAFNRIPLVDFNSVLVDPSTGNWLVSISNGDGIHPNNAGNLTMAQQVINAMSNYLPPNPYAVQGHVGGALAMSANANGNSQFLTNTFIAPPSGLAAAAVASGGTFAAATYYWKVTGTNANGETTGSNEASAAIVLNGSANLTWSALPAGTTGVKVYRGTATGAENVLVATLGAVTSYTDTGAAGTTASPPATNTAGTGMASGYSGANGTFSLVSDSRGFNWQQCVVAASTTATWSDASAGAVTAGDTCYFAMRYKTSSSGQKVSIQVTFFDSTFTINKGNLIINSPNSGTSQAVTEAIFVGEVVAPAGAAYAQVNVSAIGSGTYSWAQPTFYDLTALGLSS